MRKLTAYLLMALVFALIACGGQPKLYSVGGSVTGLNGTLTLQNNGADDLVITVDGSFTFATKVADGNAYDVTVKQGPTTQNCAVTNGSGTISGAGVTNVLVGCTNKAWYPPANLADHLSLAESDASSAQVSMNSAGDVVVVWQQADSNDNNQIFKAERHDGSWSGPADLSEHLSLAGTEAFQSQVAMNDAGDVVVVWRQKDGNGNNQIYKAERHDGSWSGPADLSEHLSLAGTDAFEPQVAINAAGDVVVVWRQKDGNGEGHVYKAERHDGSWSTPANSDDYLSVAGTSAYEPQLALNDAGDAVVVWRQKDGSADIQTYKAERHDGSWSKPANLGDHLSVAGTDAEEAQVAMNADGDAVVVWTQDDGSYWQTYKAERHDGSWSTPANLADRLSLAGSHTSDPQVALNAAGDAVVVWQQYDGNGVQQIYKAERHSGNWILPANLDDHPSPGGADAFGPQVALNDAGDAVVVWHQNDGSGPRRIYKAERHGGSWTLPANLDDHLSMAGTSAYDPQVALSANGDAVVVWWQIVSALHYQIYKAEYR